MVYVPLNLPNGTTLTAEHLRHIEQGISGADNERVVTLNASSSAQDFQYAYTIYSTESAQVSYSDGDGELCSLIGVQDIGGEPTYYFLKPSKDLHIIVKTNIDTGAVTITKNSVGVIKISLNADAGTLSAEDLLTLSKNPERVVFERSGFYYFAENLSSSSVWCYSCNVYWGTNGQIIKRVVEVTTSTGAYKKSDYPYTPITYGAAGSALGLVKSGGDVTIADGVITVNDDSHNHVIANVDGLQDALDAKLAKTTYEESKELALADQGKVCLGKFGAYDTNITIELNSTTHLTYHATIVIQSQNIYSNNSQKGSASCYVYDDADNHITPLISVFYPHGSASRQIEVYADLPTYSKNLVHVQGIGIADGGMTDVLTSVSEIPTAIDGKIKLTPVNVLTANFASKAEIGLKADQTDVDQLYDIASDNLDTAKKYTDEKVAGIVDSSPETLNTLNELAAALGDDPNFATTVATEIGKKANQTDVDALNQDMDLVTQNFVDAFGRIADLEQTTDGLHKVATSGSYNDLADKPTIPAAVTVDSALSSTSTNPVQNKVINSALAGKANANEVVKLSDNPLTLSAQSSYDCNTCYDGKVCLIAGGNNVPSGAKFGALFTMPYRKASGNTIPDFAGQIFIPNGDDPTKPNSMFFRTSLNASWNPWQEVATVAQLSGYVTNTKLEEILGSYVNDIDALLGG